MKHNFNPWPRCVAHIYLSMLLNARKGNHNQQFDEKMASSGGRERERDY